MDLPSVIKSDQNLSYKKKSECYESIIKYRFETKIAIIDKILLKEKQWDSPIINIYLLLPDYVNLATPENFSIVSKDRIPNINYLYANNRAAIEQKNYSEIYKKSMELPPLEPNEKNYLLIRYIEGSSPGYVYFEYYYTNTWIVFVTFLAVILGLFASGFAFYKILKYFYYWIKKSRSGIGDFKENEKLSSTGNEHSKALRWIILSISAYVFLVIYVILRNPDKEFEINIAMFAAIPTIILVGATIMYVESSLRLVKETQLQRKRIFIEEIINKILIPLLKRLKGQIEWCESNNLFHVKEQKCQLSPFNIKNQVFSQHQDVFFKLFSKHYNSLSKKIEVHIGKISEIKELYSVILNKINSNEFGEKRESIVMKYQKSVKGKDLFPNSGYLSKALDYILESIIKNQKSNNMPVLFWDEYKKQILKERERHKKDFELLNKRIIEMKISLEDIKNDVINTINMEQEKYGILAMN